MMRTRWAYLLLPLGTALLTISLTLVISGTSYFVLPVTEELGIPRSAFLVHFSLYSLLSLVSVPIGGRVAQRFGARRFIVFGAIWTALGLFGMSISNSLWMFYLFGAWIGLTLFPTTTLLAVVLINAWFAKRRGLLVGVAMGAGGVGGIISSAILPGFIDANGWRAGYMLTAAIFAALLLIAAAFLIRNTPQDVGLEPYGLEPQTQTLGLDPAVLPGVPYRQALRSPQLWLLFVGIMIFFSVTAGLEHYPAHLMESGFDPMQLAGTMTIFYTAAIGVLPLVGFITDRIGMLRTLAVLWAAATAGWIMLAVAGDNGTLMAAGIYLLLAAGAIGVLPPLLTQAAFGPRDYSGLVGMILPAGTLGVSIAAPLWGLAHDLTGSYTLALVSAPITLGIGFTLAAIAMRSARAQWFEASSEPILAEAGR